MSFKPNTVWICYPHGGGVENAFLESLVNVLRYDQRIVDCRGGEGLYIADNRDRLARHFMRGDAEWLWFIDTDIAFAPNTLELLLASAHPEERPIMSALYFGYMQDGSRLTPIWYAREDDGRITNLTKFGSGPQRLGVVGMGCCLIHRSVFEKFGDKYVDTGWLYFGHDVAPWVPKASIDNDFTPFGEDNCFCHRANELGIPVYGDGSIVVEHRKKRYESLQTFLKSFGQGNVEADEKGAIVRLRREPGQEVVRPGARTVDQPDDAGQQPGSQAGHLVGLDGTPIPYRNGELR